MRRRLIVTVLALPLGFLALEAGLRFSLFSDAALAHWLGDDLRHASYFTSQLDETGEDHWKLFHRFHDQVWSPPFKHPDLGWVSNMVDPETMHHKRDEDVGERRPVLVYGSSHARNNSATTLRHHELFAASEFGDELGLLNFAVSGYSLFQSVMLLEATLPLYAERKPVVLLSVMIDRDLDRAALDFRQMPQPVLRSDTTGRLFVRKPKTTDTALYLRENPIGITSYVWNYVLYGTEFIGSKTRDRLMHTEEAATLRKAILAECLLRAQTLCKDAGCPLAIIVQQAVDTTTDPAKETWREIVLFHDLDRLEIPYVSATELTRKAAAESGTPIAAFFNQGGLSRSHPSDAGMHVINKAYVEAVRILTEAK
jgi:hypothetical protein